MSLIIIIVLMLFAFYKILTSFYYLSMEKKLKHADLPGFKKLLGSHFQYKSSLNGIRRCKWTNNFIVVKASFDEEGNLTTNRTHPNHFLKQCLTHRFRLSLE